MSSFANRNSKSKIISLINPRVWHPTFHWCKNLLIPTKNCIRPNRPPFPKCWSSPPMTPNYSDLTKSFSNNMFPLSLKKTSLEFKKTMTMKRQIFKILRIKVFWPWARKSWNLWSQKKAVFRRNWLFKAKMRLLFLKIINKLIFLIKIKIKNYKLWNRIKI